MKILTQAFQVISDMRDVEGGEPSNILLPQAIAFLVSRHCIFHSSVIPELLIDQEVIQRFSNDFGMPLPLFKLFNLSDTMQFASHLSIPSLADDDPAQDDENNTSFIEE